MKKEKQKQTKFCACGCGNQIVDGRKNKIYYNQSHANADWLKKNQLRGGKYKFTEGFIEKFNDNNNNSYMYRVVLKAIRFTNNDIEKVEEKG